MHSQPFKAICIFDKMYVGVNQQRKGSKVVKLHALKLRTGLILRRYGSAYLRRAETRWCKCWGLIFISSQPWKWRSSSVSRKMYSASNSWPKTYQNITRMKKILVRDISAFFLAFLRKELICRCVFGLHAIAEVWFLEFEVQKKLIQFEQMFYL